MYTRNLLVKKKLGFILVSIMVVALLLSGCGNNNAAVNNANKTTETPTADNSTTSTEVAAPAEKTVIDSMGHSVVIPANPERIIGSYLEDYLVTLGIAPVAQWSVANGIQDYLSTGLKDIPTISYDLPPEAVASFTPDLIIIGAESQVENGLYEQYSKIAPTYVLGSEVNSDWRTALTTIAEIVGKSDVAEKALQDYDQKVADTKVKLTEAIQEQSAAILWLTGKQFYLVDETLSSGAVLYSDLGMTPPNLVAEIPQDAKATWNPISLEKLATLDADHIFILNSDKGQDDDTTKSTIWSNLAAVKAGNVYELESTSSWLYTGYIAGVQVMDDVIANLVK
ncbi:ABC transporter substrate-binding protein [Paenibacillus crassostreae]|uniref:ABC transporter substrate-binding protein n=1 Tax=Paenibacillus crassostreae TaxID=1763538 RepID=A0A167G2Q5_9BACL|nr:ABC transporter substrate-binding protein [Paenibacillus crassostreae]AOZ93820.1 ABC transporter substrate-binding protein [Paenibacillus crassostreae]OAB77147.1 ABC transporter substrate-binding protein [Paenibacillus crassostreae]